MQWLKSSYVGDGELQCAEADIEPRYQGRSVDQRFRQFDGPARSHFRAQQRIPHESSKLEASPYQVQFHHP
eukprot:gene635-1228_t